MKLRRYFTGQHYRVPVLLIVAQLAVLAALNAPSEWVQVHVAIKPAAVSDADKSAGEIQRAGFFLLGANRWDSTHRLGRFAGWPQVDPVPSCSSSLFADWLAAIGRNQASILRATFVGSVLAFGLHAFALSLRRKFQRVRARKLLAFTSVPAVLIASGLAQTDCCNPSGALYRSLVDRGTVGCATDLPMLATAVPACLFYPICKLDSVDVGSLSPEVLDQLVEQSSVQNLRLRDCEISQRQWHALVSHPGLKSLCLQNCTFLQGNDVHPTQDWALQKLTLDGGAGLENLVADLEHAAALSECYIRQLDCIANLLVSSLPRQTLQSLEIEITEGEGSGSPRAAESRSPNDLHIEGFNQLIELVIGGSPADEAADQSWVKVAHCPRLTSISLSKTHWWQVELSDLPQFTELTAPCDHIDDARDTWPTVEKLRFRNLPSLRKLQLASCGLESLDIDGCPALYGLSLGPGDQKLPQCNHPPRDRINPNRSVCCGLEKKLEGLLSDQQWLAQLKELDLSDNVLSNTDLSFLRRLKGLERLVLDESEIKLSGIEGAAANPYLKSLSMKREKLSSLELNLLLDAFPNLRSLYLDAVLTDKLELVDRPHLQKLNVHPVQSVDEAIIEDCPRLEISLYLTRPLESLRIKNAPLLQELYVAHPVPRGTVLTGLRQLKEVYLGGEHVADQHVEELSRCRDLDILFLEAPKVTPNTISKLRACERLTVLLLPNTQVDDRVVRSLGSLKKVCELDLTHTAITKDSLDVISRFDGLQKLFLGHTAISPSELQPIGRLTNLFHLDVSGIGVDQSCLEAIGSIGKLERLNLSSSKLDERVIETLCQREFRKMILIELSHCSLPDQWKSKLEHAIPNAFIETTNTLPSSDDEALERMKLVFR